MAFSIAAEIERDLISKPTKEGIYSSESSGHKIDRPKRLRIKA
jgi:DNA invertase Pin-like site-specific DNA recombinase